MSRGSDCVVVVRLRQLGDVLAGLPTLQALKSNHPGRRVVYVVEAPYADLLRGFGVIDEVSSPPRGGPGAWRRYLGSLRRLRPSAAIDLHGSARSALITWCTGAPVRIGFDVRGRKLAYTRVEPRGEFRDGVRVPHTPLEWGMRLARHAGAGPSERALPRYQVSSESQARVRAALEACGMDGRDIGALVGLNPGRPLPVKSWSTERFAQLARRVVESGRRVLITWGPGEEQTARDIARVAGRGTLVSPATPLLDMPALLEACAALVTIDSGLKHLAACARVPTVTMFGATDPREWHMGGASDAVLWRGLSCSPCRRLQCPFGAPCMDHAVEAVWQETQRVLASARREANG
jgi:ADP-heptose:LPS heptosyltransferase